MTGTKAIPVTTGGLMVWVTVEGPEKGFSGESKTPWESRPKGE